MDTVMSVKKRPPSTKGKRVLEPLPSAAEKQGWGFLSNHCHVLVCLHLDAHMPLREVAVRVGITLRAVQRIVAELTEDGFITISKEGRNNVYEIHGEKYLRHPLEAHHRIRNLLELLEK